MPCVHFLPAVVFGTVQVLPRYLTDIKRVIICRRRFKQMHICLKRHFAQN